MSELDRVSNHEVFRVERAGDLLIVTPTGDKLEFSTALFQAEFNRVKQLAGRPEFRNVLIDLSNAAYFGSEMIGALVELRRIVAGSEAAGGSIADGGVTALCGLSPDMQAGLRIMNVDTLLLTFDSRSQAVKTLSRRTIADRVGGLGIPWRGLLAAGVLIGVVVLLVATPVGLMLFGDSPTEQYRQVVSTYERWAARSGGALSSEAKARANKNMITELNELAGSVRRYGYSPERATVAEAARRLAMYIQGASTPGRERDFQIALTKAHDVLQEVTDSSPGFPDGLARIEDDEAVADDANDVVEPTGLGEVEAERDVPETTDADTTGGATGEANPDEVSKSES